jgi:broad specificity phosphatase PhoE
VLLLVRHGETAPNRHGQYLGRADVALTARGVAQARALAHALPSPDVVVTSPLRRARMTAEVFDAPTTVDERWIELDYGRLDQQPVGSLPRDVAERWRREPTFAPPGVETFAELAERVHPACASLVDAAIDSVVVVVTHVGPVKASLAWALGVPLTVADRLFVEDAGVSRVDVIDGRPVVRWFNRLGAEPGESTEEPPGRLAPRR